MNYYTVKAYLSAEELSKLDATLVARIRAKDYHKLELILEQRDKLAEETRRLDAIAQSRLGKEL